MWSARYDVQAQAHAELEKLAFRTQGLLESDRFNCVRLKFLEKSVEARDLV